MQTMVWLMVLAALLAVGFWPGHGLVAQWGRFGQRRLRRRLEDALKHVLAWERRGKSATPESLAGALSISPRRTLDLINRMENKGLLRPAGDGHVLTPQGEQLALHVVRAHRLWERYLADDAGVPMARLHQAAEKAEHELTAETLDRLEAHLGHPLRDPHGDPIPSADGQMARLDAVPLSLWPVSQPARIVHVEDEPEVIFRQIVAADLRPGMTIQVEEKSPERFIVSDGENEHRLSQAVAANIQVTAAELRQRPTGLLRLADLPGGVPAKVIEFDEACRGFSRRRLMDLGLTPDTRVEVALENTFGDPRAYRVRGSTIALRRAQAGYVWVERLDAAERSQAA